MSERWIANKFGLFNFWYYDEEEFQLLNGKILLRGSNGSGKSVTTQSFIPLLLDGNKSPSRLDPFGSTARRMENYLLHDEHEDRIGYLYIEFKKPKSGLYITIGIGIRAKKYKQMDSWYFILKDGRRINKDFKLYKKIGEKYPLTKQQFKNILGEGNVFTESQKEYMNKVNEHLFGFSDIENYEELLKLLIEIRSPKLSKEFKPTKIYNILNNSQKTLSEDDLRPMAEAMDNMDTLNMRLMTLGKSLKAAEGLRKSYDNYNKYILFSKSKDYLERESYIRDLSNQRKELLHDIDELKNKQELMKTEVGLLEDSYNKAKVQYEKLMQNDIFSTKNELENLKIEIDAGTEQVAKLKENLHKKNQEIKERENILQDTKNEQEYLKRSILFELDNLKSYGEEFSFEEDKFLKSELLRDIVAYDFTFIKNSLDKEEKSLSLGLKAIKEYEKVQEKKEKCELHKDKTYKIIEGLESQLKESYEYFTQIKEEYMEKINIYNKNNNEFKLSEKELQELFKVINKVECIDDLGDIKPLIVDIYSNLRGTLLLNKQKLNEDIKVKKEEIKELEDNIRELKEQKQSEFILDEMVEKSRKVLTDYKIPFISFYKAFDFKQDSEDEQKRFIENALIDMGIIDALIVPKEYGNKVNDLILKDKYLCVDNYSLKNVKDQSNLSSFLKLEKGEFVETYKNELEEILQSISIKDDKDTYIISNGEYSIGVIKGKTSSKDEVKYIGEESRRKYREYLIEKKFEEVNKIKIEITSIEESLNYLQDKLGNLQREYEAFPSKEDLKVNLEIIEEKEYQLKRFNNDLVDIKEQEFQINKEIVKLKKNVFERTSNIDIQKDSKSFEDALDALRDYEKTLISLEIIIEKFKNYNYTIQAMCEQIEYIREYADNILQSLADLNIKLHEKINKSNGLREVLVKSNLKEIEKAIEESKSIVDTYPKRITDGSNEVTRITSNIQVNLEKEEKLKNKIQRGKELFEIVEQSLIGELQLNYVDVSIEDDLSKKAKYVINNYKLDKNKDKNTYARELFESVQRYEGDLRGYNLKNIEIFVPKETIEDEEKRILYMNAKRFEIVFKFNGTVSLYNLIQLLKEAIEEQKLFISEKERQIFEETLINTISTKITAKIYQTKVWVEQMDNLMKSMNTSSGLKFSLKWVPRKSNSENELDIVSLVNILQRGAIVGDEDIQKLSKHFKEKLIVQKREIEASDEVVNYQSIIKNILDYRQWYEFRLYFSKPLEGKKELTDNEFFKFSGGEKAMAMYVPLFAAINAKYNGADKKDCPRIIALDEAFAGVDENNISDMFKLLEKMNLDYVLNSQVLWGDYDTVKELAICELTRDSEDDIIVVERFQWNGKEKVVVFEGEDIE
ncbi:hypothetical protein Z968_06065 [Clostridium novyi A str. 4552]|uniref:TIGR02680 family protein n=1 Tax=Clostridium novyi A str. 4552 TaxID=1444289 RepID=A0A0A0IAH5_CLONO|nr:TIGR02680 family protein [Clostridium novyi]KGM96600.1 hypothetical protein Z968_06065 [Clostridium novyi A str. 4552]